MLHLPSFMKMKSIGIFLLVAMTVQVYGETMAVSESVAENYTEAGDVRAFASDMPVVSQKGVGQFSSGTKFEKCQVNSVVKKGWIDIRVFFSSAREPLLWSSILVSTKELPLRAGWSRRVTEFGRSIVSHYDGKTLRSMNVDLATGHSHKTELAIDPNLKRIEQIDSRKSMGADSSLELQCKPKPGVAVTLNY